MTFSPSIEYSHLFTEDLWSKSSLAKFSTDSGVLRSALEFDIAALWSFREVPIGLHPFLVRTDVSNAAHEALGFSYLHDVGFDFTFDTSKIDDFLFSEMRLGAAYIFADDFSGYRIGISADL